MEGYDYVSNEEGVPVPDVKKGANLGITPRCIKMLFDQTNDTMREDEDIKYTISCSFL